MLLTLILPATACSARDTSPGPTGPTSASPASPPPTPSVTRSPSAGGGQGGGGATATGTATTQLAGFISQARVLDSRLRRAATLINGGVHKDVIVLAPATVAAVDDINPRTLVPHIPSGMSPSLQRAVMLVYSDVVSRRLAMRRVTEYAEYAPLPREGTMATELVASLGNGAPAARRFNGDLAALRHQAATSAPVRVAPRSSRSTAEVLLRTLYIDMLNGGCDSSGGGVLTTLPPIVWTHAGGFDGTINGISFKADYSASTGWKVMINAC
ncbi:hypothetical protein ODJ79_35515 [Actinoplanes sp. KI2]|uniref:hypothetical protein n=1 Tax=Actinoplanes sp. KI2 TaxID=2983315 RepID=UPI0021D5AF4F|nr:hypothetical protein [Actinoplanes sp. KI2]MCU7729052.1 hypothetical protein [Actinoplanes sp. KI2]